MGSQAVGHAEAADRPLIEPAAGLVVISAIMAQVAAAVAVHVFDRIGAVGTAGGRIGFAALFLVIGAGLPRGRSRADWQPVVPLGITLASDGRDHCHRVREVTIERTIGPRNSTVTATPSGSRSSAR